ncbi:putative LRR receptor-like serine/threonine-protein kinase [Gossypium australe]|uniref:Putative LRR receptor-like serine/threonine-protein kinase n=1 Tax=Gossypium australe TaxID=47621 RepID=A0A5B6WPY2_9ROSI|nr:putative LRR receptor-like serine/threonine-protein kinase [Gossypium australe]
MPLSDVPLDSSLNSIPENAPDSPFSNVDDTTSSAHDSDPFSPTPEISINPVEPPPHLGNTHFMVTQSKVKIFKSNVLTVELPQRDLRTIDKAFASNELKMASQEEWYSARRKGRLVGKGCSQVPGCDFHETFNLVVKLAIIRTILSTIVTKRWSLRQVDMNNVFLNGNLTKEVYMQQPLSYVQTNANDQPLSHMYILVYVDNIIITSDSLIEIDAFEHRLHTEFSLKDMGSLHYFLGVEVTRSSTVLFICVNESTSLTYWTDVIWTRLKASIHLWLHVGTLLNDPREYRSLARALQYVVLTRPDIAYVVNRIYQFIHTSIDVYFVVIKHIMCYLCATINYELHLQPSERLSLIGYVDANWGLDSNDRRSTTGYYVYFGGNPVSWC